VASIAGVAQGTPTSFAGVRSSKGAISSSNCPRVSLATMDVLPLAGSSRLASGASVSACFSSRAAESANATTSGGALSGGAHLLEQALGDGAIHVVAAERTVAAAAFDLKNAVFEPQNRDVEGAAAQVVDGEQAVLLVLEPVGQRGRGRLVQQAQDLEPGEPPGVFGRLALRVVEIRGHRDDDAAHATQLVDGALLQALQNFGAHLDRRHHAPDIETDTACLFVVFWGWQTCARRVAPFPDLWRRAP